MCKIICITNRSLCGNNFLSRLEAVAAAHPDAVILREKDLSEAEYLRLAQQAKAICEKHQTPLILHSFSNAAKALSHKAIHLPMPVLRTLSAEERSYFSVLGASCHSVEEAKEAEQFGCTYITAGNIFETDCKKGLPGKGAEFLREICEIVNIDVYALGGISARNIAEVMRSGADGACIMSGFMKAEDPEKFMEDLRHAIS
ncbi:MAG: thiamine phosphate synthase [Ruminococcus sp.]